jgi:PAS domain S-box-containing protein
LGGRWGRAAATPASGVFRRNRAWEPWAALVTALATSIGAAHYVLALAARRARIAQETVRVHDREARLASIAQQSVDALITVDEHGTIEAFNPASERIFGYAASEAIGANATMLMPDAFEAGRAALAGPRELVGRRKDGSTFPIELSVSEVHLSDRRVFSGVLRDVTQRKEIERELLGYAAELERSNKELNDFAYVASHDLKAPLRVIANIVQWLEEDLAEHLTGDSKENMEMLRGRVLRMDKLLTDLLEYSRVGRARDARYNEIVDGATLLADVLELLAPPPGMRIEVAPELAAVRVQRMPLQQAIHNLIGNAIKHHDKPDGTIWVEVVDGGEHYRFTVRDDGPGIPKKFHDVVFQLFQTLKPRDQVEGSGMGLALVKKIVLQAGGELALDSDAGRGAAFAFTWPKLDDPAPA